MSNTQALDDSIACSVMPKVTRIFRRRGSTITGRPDQTILLYLKSLTKTAVLETTLWHFPNSFSTVPADAG